MPFEKGKSGNPGGQWRPGQSGNPAGRPKVKKYREELMRQLALANDQGYREIVAAQIAKAKAGDVAAMKEIADRTDGKVPTPIGGTDELPPVVTFSWANEAKDDTAKAVTDAALSEEGESHPDSVH